MHETVVHSAVDTAATGRITSTRACSSRITCLGTSAPLKTLLLTAEDVAFGNAALTTRSAATLALEAATDIMLKCYLQGVVHGRVAKTAGQTASPR